MPFSFLVTSYVVIWSQFLDFYKMSIPVNGYHEFLIFFSVKKRISWLYLFFHAITSNMFSLILLHIYQKFDKCLDEYLEEIEYVVIIFESYSLCRNIANNAWKLEEICYAYVSFYPPIPLPFTVLHFRIVTYWGFFCITNTAWTTTVAQDCSFLPSPPLLYFH